MSEIEKDAKVVGEAAKRGAKGTLPEQQVNRDYALKGYGIDYFGGTGAKRHAENLDTKTKALREIRDIYEANVGQAPVVNVDVTEKDVEAYKAFQDLEYLRDFENFAGESFLAGANPAQVKWFYDIYPELFERRVEELDKVLNIQKKMAIMNIMGPRSKEDLLFMYEVDQMKQKDNSRFETLFYKPVTMGVGEAKNWTRGMLNIFKSFPPQNQIADMSYIGRGAKNANIRVGAHYGREPFTY